MSNDEPMKKYLLTYDKEFWGRRKIINAKNDDDAKIECEKTIIETGILGVERVYLYTITSEIEIGVRISKLQAIEMAKKQAREDQWNKGHRKDLYEKLKKEFGEQNEQG